MEVHAGSAWRGLGDANGREEPAWGHNEKGWGVWGVCAGLGSRGRHLGIIALRHRRAGLLPTFSHFLHGRGALGALPHSTSAPRVHSEKRSRCLQRGGRDNALGCEATYGGADGRMWSLTEWPLSAKFLARDLHAFPIFSLILNTARHEEPPRLPSLSVRDAGVQGGRGTCPWSSEQLVKAHSKLFCGRQVA